VRSLILARLSPTGRAIAPVAAAQEYHDRHLIAAMINLEKLKQIVHAVKNYVAREVVGARRRSPSPRCLDLSGSTITSAGHYNAAAAALLYRVSSARV
jgi:hypothetical protein